MNIVQEFDTIAAIATPLGTGGVGVIRISGPESYAIARKIFDGKEPSAGKISHGWIEEDGTKIDEVLLLAFKAPNSYTGEDVIEIQCHGGINVVKNILNLVLKNGARTAERGEFTKRAFLNNKLNLSQAEAVADLIHARTQKFAIQSAKNLSGTLSHEINLIKGNLFEVMAHIIAAIDFPDEVKEPDYPYIIECFEKTINEIDRVLACAKSSDILRQGVKVAIVGKPNVGKSSLFNRLLNMERAIVTDIAGTTRDILRETLDMDIAVTLIDTAGIRNTGSIGKVEEIGIEFSKQSADEADLILFLYNSDTGQKKEDKEIYKLIKDKPHITIANKCDLISERKKNTVYVSTLTGEGLDDLKSMIKQAVSIPEETEFVTNKRQEDCLIKSRKSLVNALNATKTGELQDLILTDTKSALIFLDEITGEVITDKILNNIFDNFCIGK